MIKRLQDIRANQAAPMVLPTARVFVSGTPIYMRFTDWTGRQKMVLLNSLGLQGSSNVMSASWVPSAAEISAPPALGARVQCFTVVAGVLYTVAGRISGQVEQQPLRIDLVVDQNCNGVNLRRHARFTATGTLKLKQPGSTDELEEHAPYSLDLSPGGLGVVLRDGGWLAGDLLQFSLTFTPERCEICDIEFSALSIAGTMVIRKRSALPEPNTVRLGCEFTELSDNYQRLLRLLISTHGAALRKT